MKTHYGAMSIFLFLFLTFAPNLSLTVEAKETGPLWGYFHPSWTTPSAVFETSDLAHIAGDPENRIEQEMQIPSELRGRVLFWASVFTRFNSHMKVIHDRNNPGLV